MCWARSTDTVGAMANEQPASEISARARKWALGVALLVVAAGLRLWRIGWGLAEGLPALDEHALWAVRLTGFVEHGLSLESLAPLQLSYPPVAGYLAGAGVWLATELGFLEELGGNHLAGPIFVGRLVTAVVSIATVPLTGWFVARLFGEREGWIAAALMAVYPVAVGQAHYLSVDPFLCATIPIIGLASLALYERPGFLRGLAVGGTVGLAFAVKYNGVAFGILPGVMLLGCWARFGFRVMAVSAAGVGLGAIGAGVLFCPPCVVHWGAFLSVVTTYSAFVSLGITQGPYGMSSWAYFAVGSIPGALGWPAYLAALGGAAVALRRRTLSDALVVTSLLVMLVPMATSYFFLRYLLPTLPLFAALGARGLSALFDARPALGRVVSCGVLSAGLLISLSWLPYFSTSEVLGAIAEMPRKPRRVGVLGISEQDARYGFEWRALEREGFIPVAVTVLSNPGPRAREFDQSCETLMEQLVVSHSLYAYTAKTFDGDEPYEDSSLFDGARCWKRTQSVCRACGLDAVTPWWWPGRVGYNFGVPNVDVYTKKPGKIGKRVLQWTGPPKGSRPQAE